ncbi:hypothetical protein JTE90_018459 [Oedothorax gibbosus]|uniref:Small G protein signaling modulator 1 n=1 Tax=Oedothorax gibbosus TaxID=931172 RepID=A0AAV6UZN4_9ARAC|nr:hypothetical protein JTE90_018459 [Oedothorax gibbosus]
MIPSPSVIWSVQNYKKMSENNSEKEYREKLLRMVKKEVKQIMEEAVTRKFVHEDSSSITSLCAAVDACLSHSLKRRALGLFKTNSTTALLQKLSKNYEEAAEIARMVAEIESVDPNKRSASSSDSTNKIRLKPEKRQSSSPSLNQPNPRFLWIRLALFEKKLAKIVDHLVHNCNKYYEKEALVADPVCGQIFASLLVGPCALDYSKVKTQDQFWTDPPADELVQRHRLSTGVSSPLPPSSTPPSVRRPALHYKRDTRASTEEGCRTIPRGYVESLHQNNKSTLLYGKNNVMVQPKEHLEPMPGYLSLHQNPDGLILKWTPNQLMNGVDGSSTDSTTSLDKSIYWEYAMNVSVEDIVYLHCHQNADSGGTIVLVGQDGVQRPPLLFPRGGHLLACLSCLENGLLPHGQMDPPLWAQRGTGKVFPKLKRKARGSFRRHSSKDKDCETVTEEVTEASDYVFRIISSLKPDSIPTEMLDPPKTTNGECKPQKEPPPRLQHHSSSSSASTCSSKSIPEEGAPPQSTDSKQGQSIQILCDTMKKQIISRAFYGWLAHCRHLRTVRTHLSGLVHAAIVSEESPKLANSGLTEAEWRRMCGGGKVEEDPQEVYRLVYFGGVDHSIRKEVWPYLLGHHAFGSTESERLEQDANTRTRYETTMSEWLAVEAIVRQRDKEQAAANIAKLSSESTNSEIPLVGPKDASLSNDVFEDLSSAEYYEHPEEDDIPEVPEEEEDKANGKGVDETNSGANGVENENASSNVENVVQNGIENGRENGTSALENGTNNGTEKNSEEKPRVRYLRHMQAVESQSILVTNSSTISEGGSPLVSPNPAAVDDLPRDLPTETLNEGTQLQPEAVDTHSCCASPASSGGGVYSVELLDIFSLNLHRIDKDVQRCDRNYCYFTLENLEKLRNVMCTYVWENLEMGYVQGMCDLVAPLLVIFDDEMLSYSCFCEIMKRMVANFPHGGAMDAHFANMRSLIQILDAEMFELMHQNGDYTHFYFCYRWFLLDFKRELLYDDVFSVWETIWVAKHVASSHFVLFLALALVEYYRDIILENNMDFTDIIKFFNEMAERHDAKAVLKIARDLVCQIQTLIDNK